MKEIGFDAKKCPLGKLGDTTIQEAYKVLKDLSDAVQKNAGISKLNDLSSKFYTLIPHNFGFKKMKDFVINSDKMIKDKNEMLNTLSDMKVSAKIMDNKDKKK